LPQHFTTVFAELPLDEMVMQIHRCRHEFSISAGRPAPASCSTPTAAVCHSTLTMTFARHLVLPLLVVLMTVLSTVDATHNTSFHGIPGTTNTISGYDTELGSNPICWLGRSASPDEDVGTDARQDVFDSSTSSSPELTSFPNVLMKDYVLAGDVELKLECPEGVAMEANLPEEFLQEGFRPRTNTWFNYTVTGTIRLDTNEIEGYHIISDDGPKIAVQIILCELGLSGFCSPFVHEQAAFRLNRDNITEVRQPGDRHGGTHVHSPYVFVPVDPEASQFEFEATIPTRVNLPGEFYAIGTVQFYTGDFNNKVNYRYDMANAVQQRVVTYQAEPEILGIRVWVERVVWIGCGLTCGLLLYVGIWTVGSLKHNVMRLSQGSLLALMAFLSVVGCGSAVMFAPTSDFFCRWNQPLSMIPRTMIVAIIAARLLRIHSGVSPLLLEHYQKASVCTTLRNRCCFMDNERWQGTFIVTLLTIPQLVIQCVELFVAPREAVVWFNQDESVGRMECSASPSSSGENESLPADWEVTIASSGFFYLLFLALALLVTSYILRNLPSLLSEARSIFVVLFHNVCASAIGMIIVAVTRDPTSSPEVQFLVRVAVTLFWYLNTCYRLVWPKLSMIRRGDTILVNKLIHPQVLDKSDKTHIEPPSEPQVGHRRIRGPSMSLNQKTSLRFAQLGEDTDDCSVVLGDDSGAGGGMQSTSDRITPFWPSTDRRILVRDDQTPNRGLLLKMVELQELLYKINTNVTSGLAVDREEWQALRNMSYNMGEVFRDRVEFEWEDLTEHTAITRT